MPNRPRVPILAGLAIASTHVLAAAPSSALETVATKARTIAIARVVATP